MPLSKDISTLRVLSVPASATAEQISRIFENNRGISLARAKYSESLSQTATVTFPDSRAAKKALGEELKIEGEKVYLDKDFLGLTVLFSHPNATIDVIAVHGLNGHAFESWSLGGAMWLRDFLPAQLQPSRIMTWGYSAGLFSSDIMGGIEDFSKQLLSEIDEIRTDEEKNRPIIFVCHSLGGVVVKRALNFARVEERNRVINDVTVGVVFLATPHQGSGLAHYGKTLGLVAKISGMREALVKDLRKSSKQLSQINDEFRQHHKRLKIGSFIELKRTRLGPFHNDIIVDRASATLTIEQEEQNPLDRDHSGICKFEHRETGDYKKVFKQIQRMAKDAPEMVESRLQPTALRPKQHFLVPYSRNPAFVGRTTILNELQGRLSDNGNNHKRIALYGLGGVGKTQITIEYSYRCKEHSSVFWVHASDYTKFERGYRKISRIAKVPGYDDEEKDILASTKDWLESLESGDWILVLDNADNLLEFFPQDVPTTAIAISDGAQIRAAKKDKLWEFIPGGSKGTIIITTRDKQVASELTGREFIRVDKMSRQEGEVLLIGKDIKLDLEEDRKALPDLLDALEYLPLAIAQAAAFMSKNYESPRPSSYLALLNENRVQLLSERFSDMRRLSGIPEAVLTTWHITFDHIQNQCPLAADLLKLTAFLDRQGIPKELLRASRLKGTESGIEFETAVGKLTGFSLLSEGSDRKTYEVHRLVHLATRESLSLKTGIQGGIYVSERDHWAITALELLSREFPGGGYEPLLLNSRAIYLPHALAVIREWGNGKPIRETSLIQSISLLSYNLGWYLRLIGRYGDAKENLLRALEGRGVVLGPEHPKTLATLSHLSTVLQLQGKYNEAEKVDRRVLGIRERVLGLEHISTLATLKSIATILRYQGKYAESEEMSRRVLEEEEKVLGPGRPDILTTLNNLALVLQCQGKYDEAVEIYQRVLEEDEKTLAPEHPSILTTLNNLACILQAQGKHSRAEGMNRRVLEAREKIFGPEHPDTLTTLNNVANALRDQGKYSEAEEMNRRVLEKREEILGPEHHDTLVTLYNLAGVLRDQGKYSEAERLNRRTLEGREKVLGPEHPKTLLALSDLALVLEYQRKYSEAEMVNRRVLEIRERLLGLEHPKTLAALSDLAFVLEYQKKYSEAEVISRRILEAKRKTLGPEDLSTVGTLENLAGILQDQGKYSEAERISRQVLEVREKVLGPEHQKTLVALNNLAVVLQYQGKHTEAEEMNRRVLEVRERILGPEHPETVITLNNLAGFLRAQGKYNEAEAISRRVLEIKEKVLGLEHPDTLTALRKVAGDLSDQGKYNDAKEINQILMAREKTIHNDISELTITETVSGPPVVGAEVVTSVCEDLGVTIENMVDDRKEDLTQTSLRRPTWRKLKNHLFK